MPGVHSSQMLNDGGYQTDASCCGHGVPYLGWVAFADEVHEMRHLMIFRTQEEWDELSASLFGMIYPDSGGFPSVSKERLRALQQESNARFEKMLQDPEYS